MWYARRIPWSMGADVTIPVRSGRSADGRFPLRRVATLRERRDHPARGHSKDRLHDPQRARRVEQYLGSVGSASWLPSSLFSPPIDLCIMAQALLPALPARSAWSVTYRSLIILRLFLALSPSYLHLDEDFQSMEPMAGTCRREVPSLYSLTLGHSAHPGVARGSAVGV